MKIVFLTPGTGSFHCGTCIRDNALAQALRGLGHDAIMVPLYLPPTLDEPSAAEAQRVFFGGVNAYVKQVVPWLRKAPRWIERLLDSPAALNAAARRAGMTDAKDLGPMTLSMLRGESGNQSTQLDDLVSWLETEGKADLIVLSNVLLVGMAREIRRRTHAKVVCTLHGEDTFLDALPEADRALCWSTIRERFDDVDVWVAVSAFHADLMASRIGAPRERISVVHNGIDTTGYRPASFDGPPTIGYLSRMCPPKGLHQLVDAWEILCRRGNHPAVRLSVFGAMTPGDEAYVGEQSRRAIACASPDRVSFHPNVDRTGKIDRIRECHMMSVPAPYGESFGLYILESLAAGVPVVQPDRGAFAEVIGATGGGVLVPADDPEAMALAWEALLDDDSQCRQLGETGRASVMQNFNAKAMAHRFEQATGMLAAAESH